MELQGYPFWKLNKYRETQRTLYFEDAIYVVLCAVFDVVTKQIVLPVLSCFSINLLDEMGRVHNLIAVFHVC